ncbi:MAG TPA: shikimate kinase AroL [Fimbriiglobus sp.]
MTRPARIVLVGYRGAGKTTVGPRLAERLGWAFADCDDLVERAAGRTVAEIFRDEGEAGFRLRESAALEDLCRPERVVIATGGGAVLREANREAMKRAGFVVWLTAPAETIHRRLAADPATSTRRPALTTGGWSEIAALLAVREPLYRSVADLILETGERSPDELATDILAALHQLGSPRPSERE